MTYDYSQARSIPGQYSPLTQNWNTSTGVQMQSVPGQQYSSVPGGYNKANNTFNALPQTSQYTPSSTQRVSTGPGDSRLTQLAKLGDTANPDQLNEYKRLLEQQQGNANQQIENDYNQAMSMLGSSEEGLRNQANTAAGTITNEAAATGTTLGAEQATKEQGVNQSLSTAEKQGTSAMQQARDVFKQTQQTNNAQMSALGLSSSSVSEALAERLGVDVARRIAGVTGSLQEVRQNATNELARIQNYYKERATQLQDWVANQKSVIQNSLVQGLNQINQARSQAASDKSASRANLLSQVQQQIYAVTQQQQQYDNALRQWAAEKAAALTPIAQDPNYVQNILAQSQYMTQQFQATKGLQDYTATPSFSYDKLGNVTGQITTNKPVNPDWLSNNTDENGDGIPDKVIMGPK